MIADPVVNFEIFSEGRDGATKNEEYRLAPSVQRYVMLEQDEAAATVVAREGDRRAGTVVTGKAELSMPEIGSSIPLTELYDELDTFPGVPSPA